MRCGFFFVRSRNSASACSNGRAVARNTVTCVPWLDKDCAHGLFVRICSISESVHCSGGFNSQKGCARKKRSGSSACIMVTSMMPVIREGGPDDLEAVESIQHLCPEAAQWNPRDYLEHDFRVATLDGVIAGFLVVRRVAPEEREILNLAVAPEHRRKGIAGRLLASALQSPGDTFFLEVRESNRTA